MVMRGIHGEDALVCILAVEIHPCGIVSASVVVGEGLHDESVVKRLAELIRNLGLMQVAHRSGQ